MTLWRWAPGQPGRRTERRRPHVVRHWGRTERRRAGRRRLCLQHGSGTSTRLAPGTHAWPTLSARLRAWNPTQLGCAYVAIDSWPEARVTRTWLSTLARPQTGSLLTSSTVAPLDAVPPCSPRLQLPALPTVAGRDSCRRPEQGAVSGARRPVRTLGARDPSASGVRLQLSTSLRPKCHHAAAKSTSEYASDHRTPRATSSHTTVAPSRSTQEYW
jgi:hypothetical protein